MTILSRWDDDEAAREDIQRKFGNTHIWAIVPELSPRPRCYTILEIGEPRAHVMWVGAPEHGELVDWRTIDVLQHMPNIGVVQYQNQIICAQRLTRRQWQLGFGSGNAVMFDDSCRPMNWWTKEADALYNATYPGG